MCLGIPGRIVEISDINDKLAIVEVGESLLGAKGEKGHG